MPTRLVQSDGHAPPVAVAAPFPLVGQPQSGPVFVSQLPAVYSGLPPFGVAQPMHPVAMLPVMTQVVSQLPMAALPVAQPIPTVDMEARVVEDSKRTPADTLPMHTAAASLPGSPARAMSSKARAKGSPPRDAHVVCTVLVQLGHGRRRLADASIEVACGQNVLITADTGFDMGVVVGLPSYNPDRMVRRKLLRIATDKDIAVYQNDIPRQEAAALRLARELTAEHQVPIKIHCVDLQFDMTKFVLHYSSTQKHPDFRSIIVHLYARFRNRIWFNNCMPSEGQPGERLRQEYLLPKGTGDEMSTD
eukprot:Hpha_TRINITY_DN16156_c6_g1::TRINITY_DN16156_c6_g1_i2::g.3502::m.3502